MREMTINQAGNELCSGIKNGLELLALARGWLKQGNPVVAIELLQPAIESAEAERDKDVRAQILKELGRARMMQSEWDISDAYYLEAQRLFAEMDNIKGAAQCARNRANMYFQQGKYRESEDLCEQAMEWTSDLNDYQLRATILNTMGAVKSATGELRESIKIFKLCLADFQSAGNLTRQGYVLLNIGLTQTELLDFTYAIESLNQALAIALDVKDLHLVEICYQNIAKCYLAQKETTLAKSVIDTARKILPGLNSRALEAELNLVDCRVLRIAGDFEQARALLDLTYTMTVANNQSALKADVLFEQGLLEKDLGNTALSIAKLDAAVNQYRLVGAENGFREAVQVLEHLRRSNHA